jgi:hypothetical protein
MNKNNIEDILLILSQETGLHIDNLRFIIDLSNKFKVSIYDAFNAFDDISEGKILINEVVSNIYKVAINNAIKEVLNDDYYQYDFWTIYDWIDFNYNGINSTLEVYGVIVKNYKDLKRVIVNLNENFPIEEMEFEEYNEDID